MKRIFHRRKDDNDDDPSPSNARGPNTARSDPAPRTSMYDTAMSAGAPQTGNYPIRGDDSSVVQQQQGQRSSAGPYDTSPASDRYRSQESPITRPNPAGDMTAPHLQASRQQKGHTAGLGPNEDKRWSPSQLPQDFSILNLGNTGPTTVTQTVTTTTLSPGQNKTRYAPQAAEPPRRNNQTIRPVTEPRSQQPSANPASKYSDYHDPRTAYTNDVQHQPSIPRKQIGTISTTAHDPVLIPRHQKTRSDPPHGEKSLPPAPAPTRDPADNQAPSYAIRQPSMPVRSKPSSDGVAAPLSGETVVDRAGRNTKETHVTETIAPAVVHETVNKNVHHVREEIITRETHNHDVFHRILPVVDVEVLPPRHFLPVEGGGLVEVGAHEVPGRGNNWVIAETVSNIPSDQAAPVGARRFSARKFPGQEGDAKGYMDPEGYERTEQTWVHPPELETGARNTGQSWPMVFGDDVSKKGGHVSTSSKSPRKRDFRRRSTGPHTSPGRGTIYERAV
ncbi:MAG: hypothetical protein Q9163_000896 [Psora crenata]